MILNRSKRIIFYLKNPKLFLRAFFNKILISHLGRLIPDKLWLKIKYRLFLGEKLNLNDPKTFNEKLQWLKLYNRNPIYTQLADKYEVRKYIKNVIGEEFLIPLYGVWNSINEIDFNKLPNQFVLKCTHDSGSYIICKDKNKFDIDKTKEKLKKHLICNFYYRGREWSYKNIIPRIIAEYYLGENIIDYKFLCFNGEPLLIFTCTERESNLKVTFYDLEWKEMPFIRHYPKSNVIIPAPIQLSKMLEICRDLTKDIPFVRIDFYEINNKIIFSEFTFYPGNGIEEFTPKEWDRKLGDLIRLEAI